jgi:hypothetical protein
MADQVCSLNIPNNDHFWTQLQSDLERTFKTDRHLDGARDCVHCWRDARHLSEILRSRLEKKNPSAPGFWDEKAQETELVFRQRRHQSDLIDCKKCRWLVQQSIEKLRDSLEAINTGKTGEGV